MILKSEVFIMQTIAKIVWAYGQFAYKKNCIIMHRDVK